MNKCTDALEKYMGHAGLLMTADGTDDELIKLEGLPKGQKYEFMHSSPDKWLSVHAQEPVAELVEDEPEPAPPEELTDELTDEMEQLEAEMRLDVPEYEELATQDEADKSGELPTIPSRFAAAPECPEMTKKTLVGETIMYDHDSGWELGKIEIVSGRGSDKLCMISFDATSWVDVHSGEQLSLHLSKETYCNTNDFTEGKWFHVIAK